MKLTRFYTFTKSRLGLIRSKVQLLLIILQVAIKIFFMLNIVTPHLFILFLQRSTKKEIPIKGSEYLKLSITFQVKYSDPIILAIVIVDQSQLVYLHYGLYNC